MIDRATVAGIAIGVGALLMFAQVFSDNPNFALLGVGGLSFALGLVFWSDLREENDYRKANQHHAQRDR